MATKDYSSKQEKLIADYLDWEVVSGSGARDFNLGDIISDDWLGECKTHTEPGTTIIFYAEVWEKICKEATSRMRHPILFVDDGSQKTSKTWCLFHADTLISYAEVSEARYPYKIKTNIRFEHRDCYKRFYQDKDFEGSDHFVYYVLEFSSLNNKVAICPLSEFSDIISYYHS